MKQEGRCLEALPAKDRLLGVSSSFLLKLPTFFIETPDIEVYPSKTQRIAVVLPLLSPARLRSSVNREDLTMWRLIDKPFSPSLSWLDRALREGFDRVVVFPDLGERQVKAYPRTQTDRRTVGKVNGRRIIGAFRKPLYGTTFRFV